MQAIRAAVNEGCRNIKRGSASRPPAAAAAVEQGPQAVRAKRRFIASQKSGLFASGTAESWPENHCRFSAQITSDQSPMLGR